MCLGLIVEDLVVCVFASNVLTFSGSGPRIYRTSSGFSRGWVLRGLSKDYRATNKPSRAPLAFPIPKARTVP